MATGFFFKTWQDVGAPQLNSGAGNLIAVLDWALDTAGATYWEKVYTGINKAVYRSKTGQRPYLRVDDAGTGTATIRMYETMTDVDTGTGRCPDGVNQLTELRWVKGYDTTAHGYWIWGDSEYFNIIAEADRRYRNDNANPQNVRFGCFGEIATYLALDNYPCIVMGAGYSTTDTCQYNTNVYGFMGNGDYGDLGCAWNSSQNYTVPKEPALCWLKTADGVHASSSGYAFVDAYRTPYLSMAQENPFYYSPVYIQDSYGSVNTTSYHFFNYYNVNSVVRARLPYIYYAPAFFTSTYSGPTTASTDTVTIGASQFLAFHSKDGGTVSAYEPGLCSMYLLRMTNDEPDRP